MRDFRDAKTMAHALRDALKNRAFESTHSECLELVAKMFGYDNSNISSAKIEATVPASDERLLSVAGQQNPAPPKTLYCSFCGKSQHEVRKLIAGPEVYICDECVELCTDFVNDLPDKDLSRLMEGGAENARIMSTEELARYVERGRMGVERNQLTLRSVQRKLAVMNGEVPAKDDILTLPRFAYLRNKTREELMMLQQMARRQLSLYEEALRLAMTALGARRP